MPNLNPFAIGNKLTESVRELVNGVWVKPKAKVEDSTISEEKADTKSTANDIIKQALECKNGM